MKPSIQTSAAAFAWSLAVAIGVFRWERVQQHDVATSFRMTHARVGATDSSNMFDSRLYDTIVSRNAFGAERFGAAGRIGSPSSGATLTTLATLATRPAAPRPRLALRAIAGPPWRAVIAGLPGQVPETIARAGATFDGIVVRSISRDTVVLRGYDTTWVLTLAKP